MLVARFVNRRAEIVIASETKFRGGDIRGIAAKKKVTPFFLCGRSSVSSEMSKDDKSDKHKDNSSSYPNSKFSSCLKCSSS